jgi:hypothetical protein
VNRDLIKYGAEHDIADPQDYALAEVAFCGYSEAERRMRLFYFNNSDNYESQDDGGQYYGAVLPMSILPEDVMPKLAGPVDAQLKAVMLAAQKFFVDRPDLMGGARMGGHVMVTAVTPLGISSRVIHEFADFKATRNAAAAIAARLLRGDEVVSVADGLTAAGDMQRADELPIPGAEAAANAAAPALGATRAERRRAEKAAKKAGRRAA